MATIIQGDGPAPAGHSAQWGLSALLLSMLIIILFPIVVMSLFAAMVGAYSNDFLKSSDIDLGVLATHVMVIGLLALAVFASLCGLAGLFSATKRRQPFGLSIAGTVLALPAVVLSLVLLSIALRCIEWSRGYQNDRFVNQMRSGQNPLRLP